MPSTGFIDSHEQFARPQGEIVRDMMVTARLRNLYVSNGVRAVLGHFRFN
jgi:hypothetical protein